MVKNIVILQKEKLSALLRGITSKHTGDFYCLISLHPFQTENKFKSQNCKNHDHCDIKMSKEISKILKYIPGQKSIKSSFAFYPDAESFPEKIHPRKKNPENLSKAKLDQHATCFTQCVFDETKKKLDYYRGKHCMKVFCKVLKEQTSKIINCEKRR